MPQSLLRFEPAKTTARSPWLQSGKGWSAGDLARVGLDRCRYGASAFAGPSAAAEQKPGLDALLNDTPWRGSRLFLHVLEVSAWEMLQSLAGAGLLTLHARAVRPLLDGTDGADKPRLSEEQRAKINARRILARRKARAARALLAGDLADEAAPALREAVLACVQAAEMTHLRSEPDTLTEALHPPCCSLWPAEIHSAVRALDANTITNDLAIVLVEWLLTTR